jgi:hypothetical protein
MRPRPHNVGRADWPTAQFCPSLPNYISQDEDNNASPMRQTTRVAARSIMQEAMLSCVDIYMPQYFVSADLGILNYTKTPKPTGTTYTVTPKQMAQRKLHMKGLCKMANSVLGVNRELLEYCHLIANQTARATWQHSYGNEIGRLAQGMRGCNTGTNTIIFIKKNQVLQNRAKDMTYGLITCLIRPEKKRNQIEQGWSRGATEYTTWAMQAHQSPTYLQSSSSLTAPSALLTQSM